MFAYLSKKLEMSSGATVRCLSWSTTNNYLACGCDNGLLKVLKIDPCKLSPSEENAGIGYLASPTNILINQTLEGHSSPIQVIAWNDVHNKLTTSDARGLIVVWMLYKGSWYEEMVNNRNKSTVRGLSWSSDGEQICIVYEDGGVIVGSADGNRLWSKELKGPKLSGVNWSPDTSHLLFTLFTGEIMVYDAEGEFVRKLEVETSGMSGDEEENAIVAVRWHHGGTARNVRSLAVVFRMNTIYLLTGINDNNPLQIQGNLTISCAEWSPSGAFLAIGGSPFENTASNKLDEIKIFSNTGNHLYTLTLPVKEVVDLAWDSWNLRLAVGSGANIFFVNIRPYYKVAYFGGHMFLYSYEKEDGATQLAFWDQEKTNLQEIPGKVLELKGNNEMCAILSSIEDFYTVALVNTVGLALDSLTMSTLEPFTMALTESVVVVVAPNAIVIWRIHRESLSSRPDLTATGRREKVFHIDDFTTSVSSDIDDDHLRMPTSDPVVCADAKEHVLVVGRASGVLHLYSLPHGTLITVFSSNAEKSNLPRRIFLNLDGSQVAMLDQTGGLSICTLGIGNNLAAGTTKNYDKKDIWDLVWASDNPNLFCVMEKTRLYIISEAGIEEPVISSGYLMYFSDLRVTTVLMDELMHSPDSPKPEFIVKYEARPLRDTRALLENDTSLGNVFNYIEENSFPILWQMLARKAMSTLDLSMAETAFVRCRDYRGVQLTKELLASNDDDKILKARVCAHYMEFDEAEKHYRQAGRTDLLNEMWALLGRWKKVEIVQLIKSSADRLSEDTLESLNIEMGDCYADEGNWAAAKPLYEQGRNPAKIFECCLMLEDYPGLVALSKSLPPESVYHEKIGDVLAAVGLCDMAVGAYVQGKMYDEAVECAVQLSEWTLAMELSQKYKLASQGVVLVRFARYLVVQGDIMDAIDKFKSSKQPFFGARIAAMLAFHHLIPDKFDAVLVRKLFSLAASLMLSPVEDVDSSVELDETYDMLMPAEFVPSMEVVNWLEANPWRGVEAIDLYVTLQRDLYSGMFDKSVSRGKKLLKFRDILGNERTGSLLALAASNARDYAVTSEAFMLLEATDSTYAELSFKLFGELEYLDVNQTSSSQAGANSRESNLDIHDQDGEYDYPED